MASGKGGTGKTTISLNLHKCIKNSVLVDCDVEEPNDNLFLQQDLELLDYVSTLIPVINHDKCTGCGLCVDKCRYNALNIIKGRVLVLPNLCHGCGLCSKICPEKAITEKTSVIGETHKGKNFFQGELAVGKAMATPIIKALLTKVKSENEKNKSIIFDSPPGSACPVIATMSEADKVLLITEPSPLGLHDLKAAAEVSKVVNKPLAIVINKSVKKYDNLIEKFAQDQGIPILLKIPFNKKIAEKYAQGKLIVDEFPEWEAKFHELWNDLKELQ